MIIFGIGFMVFPGVTSALTISPPVKEFTGNPGETVNGMVRLYNETDIEISAFPSLNSFAAQGEEGDPLVLGENEGKDVKSLSSWITIAPGPFTIKPLDWQNALFEIRIPKDAEPGGHYAALFFSPNANNPSQAVTVDYKTGALLLLTVSGKTTEEGNIESFITKNNKIFYEFIPVGLELRIKNTGSIHFRPGGAIQIDNMFGSRTTEVPIITTNSGGNVLPNSIRKYDVAWGDTSVTSLPNSFWGKVKYEWKNFHFGKYTAQAVVALPLGKTEVQNISFWIIPWQLLLVVLFILSVVVFLFRTYTRWVIRQARKK